MPYKEPAPVTVPLELREQLDIIREYYGYTWLELLELLLISYTQTHARDYQTILNRLGVHQ